MYLHADLDAFYASVEQRDRPALLGRPVIVGMGVVLAASYEAKAYGVRTAMGGREARRLCPPAIVVPPRMEAYSSASKAVFEVFDDISPWVEGLSIDEAFLDVSGLRRIAGPPHRVAQRLREEVRDRVGLPISVGVASTKFLAKVASAVSKPDGLLVVEPGRELEFLHPLPIERLWGVGRVTSEKLRRIGLTTVADVAELGPDTLSAIVGRAMGNQLDALANNRDPRRIRVGHRRGSIGSQRALGRSRPSIDEAKVILLGIVDRVTRRMRRAERVGRTVVLRLRFGDFSRATRSHTLDQATAATEPIWTAAAALLDSVEALVDEKDGLTLIGISVANLSDANAVQLTLPLGGRHRPSADGAIDEVRDRFGSAALTRAATLGNDPGFSVPMLPD